MRPLVVVGLVLALGAVESGVRQVGVHSSVKGSRRKRVPARRRSRPRAKRRPKSPMSHAEDLSKNCKLKKEGQFPLKEAEKLLPMKILAETKSTTKIWGHNRRVNNIKDCLVLLPAGTGTASLTDALSKQFKVSNQKWTHSHDHRVRPNVSCYLMTLRDPAARFESGWRHSSRPRAVRELLAEYNATTPNLNTFLSYFTASTFKSEVNAKNNRAKDFIVHMAVLDRYLKTVAYPDTKFDPARGHGWYRFFHSQIDFLRNFKITKHNVYFICLEHFEDDWNFLLRQRLHMHPSSILPLPHTHSRGNSAAAQIKLSTLHPSLANFLRYCLYPWDTQLHHSICGSPANNNFKNNTSASK